MRVLLAGFEALISALVGLSGSSSNSSSSSFSFRFLISRFRFSSSAVAVPLISSADLFFPELLPAPFPFFGCACVSATVFDFLTSFDCVFLSKELSMDHGFG